MSENLVDALIALENEEEIRELVREKLYSGTDPLEIIEDGRKAMEVVGKRFAEGEYFLPELIYAGELLKQMTEIIKPKLAAMKESKKLGKVVIATVAGDIHDIGLNIVGFMLDVNGFEVHNMGVDVPADKIVAKVKETSATILGLSGLLTTAFDSMKETVGAIAAAGLREKTRIMIGGGQVDDEVRKYTKADAYGETAMEAVTLAKGWAGGN